MRNIRITLSVQMDAFPAVDGELVVAKFNVQRVSRSFRSVHLESVYKVADDPSSTSADDVSINGDGSLISGPGVNNLEACVSGTVNPNAGRTNEAG